MSRPRSGVGTILAFITTKTGYLMTIRRENGQEVTRPLDPDIAHRLAETYGIRARSGGGSSMATLKGAACRWRETSQGLLVEVKVLPT